jgi:large subunit ribosomal protein L31e
MAEETKKVKEKPKRDDPKGPKEEIVEKAKEAVKNVAKEIEESTATPKGVPSKEGKPPAEKKETQKEAVVKTEKAGDKEVPAQKKTKTPTLEREYTIPIQRKLLTVPKYRRAKKAITIIKAFIIKHMNIRDGDPKKVKIDHYLNSEIWFKGIKKPLRKVKVKATKNNEGIVYVSLAEEPEIVTHTKKRKEKQQKTISAPTTPVKEQTKEQTKEQQKDTEEKEKATQEAGKARQKEAAKAQKHTSGGAHKQKVAPQRKALKK